MVKGVAKKLPRKRKTTKKPLVACYFKAFENVVTLREDEFDHDSSTCPATDGEICFECKFRNNWKLWRSCSLLPSTGTESGHERVSWLAHKNGFSGCVVCKALADNSSEGFSSSLENSSFAKFQARLGRAYDLQQHAKTPQHQEAVQLMLRKMGKKSDSPPVKQAPPAAFFKLLWSKAKSGSITTRGSRKVRQGIWITAEAIRVIQRSFLASSTTMSLSSDERKGDCLLRFSASNANLQQCRGVLGLQNKHGTCLLLPPNERLQ